MRKLNMFNSVSLDGYFTDASNDMSWAHAGAMIRKCGNSPRPTPRCQRAGVRACDL